MGQENIEQDGYDLDHQFQTILYGMDIPFEPRFGHEIRNFRQLVQRSL